MPSTSPLTPLFSWDERIGRYRSISTGRLVSNAAVRDACATTAKASEAGIRLIADQFRAGGLTLAEWQTAMMREIKLLHVAEAAAARGGWAQMSQSDWGYTGWLIRRQYNYLESFAKEIENGYPLNGRFNVRCDMYGQAGRSTFEEMRARWQKLDNGMTEEALILGAAEHCEGCLEDAAKEYVPIGTLAPIGSRTCRTHCKCHKAFRKMGPNGEYIYADVD